MQRKQNTEQQSASIDDIISMLEKAVTKKSRIVKELAIRKVGEWTHELMKNYSYLGSLKKKLSDALGKLNHLNFEQKQKAWELIEQFLKPESAAEECYPLFLILFEFLLILLQVICRKFIIIQKLFVQQSKTETRPLKTGWLLANTTTFYQKMMIFIVH